MDFIITAIILIIISLFHNFEENNMTVHT